MKILVTVKRVPDYEARIRIDKAATGIETDGIKWIVNPFDEIAVEEALKIKERGDAEEVVALSIGPGDVVTQLRYALAMGADRGILVKSTGEVDSDLAAKVIAEVYRQGEYGIVMMGKQAIDSDANQTPQLVASHLGLPQACYASKIELGDGKATVTREVDGGLETLKVSMPCVISTDLRLNEPRYASLPGIMKAKKKPVEELELGALVSGASAKLKIVNLAPPPPRKAGQRVEDVNQLVELLANEAKVL